MSDTILQRKIAALENEYRLQLSDGQLMVFDETVPIAEVSWDQNWNRFGYEGSYIEYMGFIDSAYNMLIEDADDEYATEELYKMQAKYPKLGLQLVNWVKKNLPPPYKGEIMNERLEKVLNKRFSSVDNLSQEILALVAQDPAAKAAVQYLAPHGEVFVVGGAPRDVVLGKSPKDIDLMARVDGDIIKDTLSKVDGGKVFLTGKQFPVYRFKYQGSEVEIALPRTEEKIPGGGNKDWKVVFGPEISVEEDLRRRDFTSNAIAVNAVTGEIVDPFGGIKDIQEGQVRTVTDTSFRDDSSRILRAMTQMAKHGLIPDDVTKFQMAEYASHLDKAAPELIQKELDKIMDAGNPHLAIRLAYETGVLKQFMPEVYDAFGFDQKNPHHKLELGDHLLEVLEGVLETGDPDLKLAALLHDIGKPASQWVDEQGVGHYYMKRYPDGTSVGQQHEDVGADMAVDRMRALKYPRERIDNVEFYIRNHMFSAFSTEKGARKFLQNAGSYERAQALLNLREADLGGKGRVIDPASGDQDVALMRSLLDRVNAQGSAVSLKDLAVNGRDIMEATGVKGPEIGRKLQVLLEKVIDNPTLNNRETLLQMAKTADVNGATDANIPLNAILKYIQKNGGGSFKSDENYHPDKRSGYYAAWKNYEQVVPEAMLTTEVIGNFIDQYKDVLSQPGNVLGIWIDSGQVYMDVSRYFTDPQEARLFGTLNDQISIYDSINDEVIYLKTPPKTAAGQGTWNFLPYMREIGEAYAAAQDNSGDPAVQAAWKALADDSRARAAQLDQKHNIKTVQFEPYENAEQQDYDVRNYNQFLVSDQNSEHPLWSVEDNVAFRKVHDLMGHIPSAGDFSWEGENRACGEHFKLLGREARIALFVECIMQTAAVNVYSQFLDQKCFISPNFDPELGWIPLGQPEAYRGDAGRIYRGRPLSHYKEARHIEIIPKPLDYGGNQVNFIDIDGNPVALLEARTDVNDAGQPISGTFIEYVYVDPLYRDSDIFQQIVKYVLKHYPAPYSGSFANEKLFNMVNRRFPDLLDQETTSTPFKTSAWADVAAKAKRLKDEGKVNIIRNSLNTIVADVQGDNGRYQVEINRQDPNSGAISSWSCECPWGQTWAWARTRGWKKYEGRLCAHATATYWQSQSMPVEPEAEPTPMAPQMQETPAPPAMPPPGTSPAAPQIPAVPVPESQIVPPGTAIPGTITIPGTFSKRMGEILDKFFFNQALKE